MWFLEAATDCAGFDVPDSLFNIVATIVTIIKIGVPIILIVLGMIDMGKAVASQKDDKIKAGQKILISRLITGGIVFFIVAIVQMLVSIIGTPILIKLIIVLTILIKGCKYSLLHIPVVISAALTLPTPNKLINNKK